MADGDEKTTFTKDELAAAVAAETKALKDKNFELIGDVKRLGDKLKPWEGKDPEQVDKVLRESADAQAAAQQAKGDWAARETTLRNEFKIEHDKIVSPLVEENKTLKEKFFDAVAVRDATEACGLSTPKANSKLLLPILRPELVTVEVDGVQVTGVKGKDGKERYHQTTGKLVTVQDRIAELYATGEYSGAFDGAPGSGTGSRPASGPGGKVYRSLADFATDKEKIDFIAANGQKAFEDLAYAPRPQPDRKTA